MNSRCSKRKRGEDEPSNDEHSSNRKTMNSRCSKRKRGEDEPSNDEHSSNRKTRSSLKNEDMEAICAAVTHNILNAMKPELLKSFDFNQQHGNSSEQGNILFGRKFMEQKRLNAIKFSEKEGTNQLLRESFVKLRRLDENISPARTLTHCKSNDSALEGSEVSDLMTAGVTCINNGNINILWLKDTIIIEDLGSDPLDTEALESEVKRLANALNCEKYKNYRSNADANVDALWKFYTQYLFQILLKVENFQHITIKCIIISHPHRDHFKLIQFLPSTFKNVESVILCGNPSYYLAYSELMCKLFLLQSENTQIFVPAFQNSVFPKTNSLCDFKKNFSHDFTVGVASDIGQVELYYCPKKRGYFNYLDSHEVSLPFTKYLKLDDVYCAVFPLLNSNFVKKRGHIFCDSDTKKQCALFALCANRNDNMEALLLFCGDLNLIDARNARNNSFSFYMGLVSPHAGKNIVPRDSRLSPTDVLTEFKLKFLILPGDQKNPTESFIGSLRKIGSLASCGYHSIYSYNGSKFQQQYIPEAIFTLRHDFPLTISFEGQTALICQMHRMNQKNLRKS